jgi:glutaconate CoA-transferase subunit A
VTSLNSGTDLDALVAHIRDGDLVALPAALAGPYSANSMAATRTLIRRGVRDLHLLGVPALSLQADILIGAGCVAVVETGSILLYEYGAANRFIAAQRAGTIEVRDSTCPAIQAALIAGKKGIPFMPLRGIIGSDLLALHEQRGDWKVIDNPFGINDPIVTVAAIRPDVALFHAPFADRYGNVWIGAREELVNLAQASFKTLVTVEEVVDGDLLADEERCAGTISSEFVTAVSVRPNGAWPLNGGDRYGDDAEHLRLYAAASRTDEGFAAYLHEYVLSPAAAAR